GSSTPSSRPSGCSAWARRCRRASSRSSRSSASRPSPSARSRSRRTAVESSPRSSIATCCDARGSCWVPCSARVPKAITIVSCRSAAPRRRSRARGANCAASDSCADAAASCVRCSSAHDPCAVHCNGVNNRATAHLVAARVVTAVINLNVGRLRLPTPFTSQGMRSTDMVSVTHKTRVLAALTIPVTAALVLAGCASDSGGNGGDSEGSSIIVGTTDKVTFLDPAGSYDNGSFAVMNQVFPFLLNSPQGTADVEPDIAESAEFNEDGDYVVTLKSGLKFA